MNPISGSSARRPGKNRSSHLLRAGRHLLMNLDSRPVQDRARARESQHQPSRKGVCPRSVKEGHPVSREAESVTSPTARRLGTYRADRLHREIDCARSRQMPGLKAQASSPSPAREARRRGRARWNAGPIAKLRSKSQKYPRVPPRVEHQQHAPDDSGSGRAGRNDIAIGAGPRVTATYSPSPRPLREGQP